MGIDSHNLLNAIDERSIKTMRPCVNLLRPGAVTLYKFPQRRDYPVLLLTRRTLRQNSRQILSTRRNAPLRVDLRQQPSAYWRPRSG